MLLESAPGFFAEAWSFLAVLARALRQQGCEQFGEGAQVRLPGGIDAVSEVQRPVRGNAGQRPAGQGFQRVEFSVPLVCSGRSAQFVLFIEGRQSLRRKGRHAATGEIVINLGGQALHEGPCR